MFELPSGEQRLGSNGRAWGAHVRFGKVQGSKVIWFEPGQLATETDADNGADAEQVVGASAAEQLQVGELMIRSKRGVMQGYLSTDAHDDFVNGWFRTGDVGHIDKDGFVWLTGRSKEVINCGADIVSPFEVYQFDAIFARHPTQLVPIAG